MIRDITIGQYYPANPFFTDWIPGPNSWELWDF